MAEYRVGAERGYYQEKSKKGEAPKPGRYYREGEIVVCANDHKPSRTWTPVDEAARKAVKGFMKDFMKEAPPPPADRWDAREMAKWQYMMAKYANEQQARANWERSDPGVGEPSEQERQMSLHSIAASAGASVRPSDRGI